jgi:DNA ligase D-like protein (predicted 3'-phosphoesterase)
MPRFVVLRHHSQRGEHFDFMLEAGGVLKTWALPRAPDAGVEIDCEALADHRLAYLDYEGPISGDRGDVSRWDCGTYAIERQNDREWAVTLAGNKLSGPATLLRSADDPERWRLWLAKDDAP